MDSADGQWPKGVQARAWARAKEISDYGDRPHPAARGYPTSDAMLLCRMLAAVDDGSTPVEALAMGLRQVEADKAHQARLAAMLPEAKKARRHLRRALDCGELRSTPTLRRYLQSAIRAADLIRPPGTGPYAVRSPMQRQWASRFRAALECVDTGGGGEDAFRAALESIEAMNRAAVEAGYLRRATEGRPAEVWREDVDSFLILYHGRLGLTDPVSAAEIVHEAAASAGLSWALYGNGFDPDAIASRVKRRKLEVPSAADGWSLTAFELRGRLHMQQPQCRLPEIGNAE